MEQLNAKIYEKYTALKKRKLLDEGVERKREAEFQELLNAWKDYAGELQNENEELQGKLADKQDELEKARMDFLEEISARDEEILRLKFLLAEKADKSNPTEAGSLNRKPPISPAKTPQSNSKTKRAQQAENSVVRYSSSPEEEAQEVEFSRRDTCSTGNGTNESPSGHMFHLLLESLVCMKISLNTETERFSVSVFHEASGYSFTLTWLEKPGDGEWSYKLSSLGTLEMVAANWMKQDIRFSMKMCRLFFERLSNIIRKG